MSFAASAPVYASSNPWMTTVPSEPPASKFPWWPLAVFLLVFTVTEIPFLLGERWVPAGTVFDGLTGMTHDQNMYFSFIRQGAEGRWLFVNRLTHVEHEPVMVNVQWLAVGRLMNWLGGSERAAYFVWRLIGTLLLVFGFWSLAGAIGLSRFQQKLAVVLCAFGGGFGWFVLILERLGLIPANPLATLDVSDALLYPFTHIFFNPHLSVSHGLSLLFLSAFAAGEKTGRARWYVAASGLAVLNGLVRPYDLILLYAVIPLYLLADLARREIRDNSAVAHNGFWRKIAWRILPLIVTGPLIAYYAALFQHHPVFKFWASQGTVRPLGLGWHLFALGPPAVLCLTRLCRFRRFPLVTPGQWLVAGWVAAVLFLFHAHRLPGFGFMPFTPVMGISLTSTMLLVGVVLLDASLFFPVGRAPWKGLALLTALVFVCSLSSAVWMAKIVRNLANLPEHYIPVAEREADVWLNDHADESDVILGTLSSSNRMARFVSARFVVGHVNVTPRMHELSDQADRFFRGQMTPEESAAFLEETRVRWIYVGPHERELDNVDFASLPGVEERFSNPAVRILSRTPGQYRPN